MIVSSELITEFIRALDEEIDAVRAGKGGSIVRVFDGRFIRIDADVFIYSFILENFIATIDDAPVEIQIDGSSYKGQIIQAQGLEIIIGLEENLGQSIPEAKLITNLYFLHEMLKKKFLATQNGEAPSDFSLSNLVFEGKQEIKSMPVKIPALEPHPDKTPNESQVNAIRLSQTLSLTLIWGPPGTGKTETLARIVECYLKRGMKVLVVSHANAAVDEATEDIAEILKGTEFYNQGKIIRLGNVQKETLRTEYGLVILENIAERLGETLKHEKEQLESQIFSIDGELEQLSSASNAISERDRLMKESRKLESDLSTYKRKTAELGARISKLKSHQNELRAKLQKAESSGVLKRLVFGLDPSRLRSQIDNLSTQFDGLERQAAEQKTRLDETQQKKSEAIDGYDSAHKNVISILKRMEISEEQLRSKERELNKTRNELLSRIMEIDNEFAELQKKILSEASVISTTLTKTFSAKNFPETLFDVLIVDEASMAPMPHLYWALGRCTKAAVIVGDFLQLPPICISDKDMAQKWLGRSIYRHLNVDAVSKASKDSRVCLLDRQYRMNPAISAIPNHMFYQGLLKDDSSTLSRNVTEGISKQPLTLVDTTSASPWCSHLSTGSRFNIYSAVLAATIAKKICGDNSSDHANVGIITPYRLQAKLIGKILKDLELERTVRADTVYRYQGGEEEIIIFDTVEGPGVRIAPMLSETLADSDAPLVLNVAMTRAKCKIFLIANTKHLRNELSNKTSLYRILSIFLNEGEEIDCQDIVDSYFMRDFEKIVKEFIDSYNESIIEPPDGSLFTEHNFYPFFFRDLFGAKQEVIILSPFVSSRRAGQFIEFFRLLAQNGIKIRVYTRPAKEQTGSFALDSAQVIEQLRTIGIEVTERRRMHQKVAIIDRSIAWEGSLNILSHRDSDEQMRRLPLSTAVNELIRLCELDESHSGDNQGKREPITTLEKCPECGEEMVVRISRYGAFLSCPDRKCSGKKSIRKWDRIETKTLCPDCGQRMIVRRGPKGAFLGCSEYPNCKKTLPIR